MNKNNLGGSMGPGEVKSTVNSLEISPSKNAGGSTTHTSPSMDTGSSQASGSVGEFKPGCFSGGSKKKY